MTQISTSFLRRIAALISILHAVGFCALAQSPSRFSSGMFASPDNWAQGSSAAMASSAGGSFIHTTTAKGTGFQYFRFFSATSGGTTYEPNGGSDILLNTNTVTGLQVTGSGKAYYVNVASTAHNYVFKTDGSGSPGSARVVIFCVQGTVATIPAAGSVTRSPSGSVYPGQSVTVSATASAVMPTGQSVYLRYTTDNWTTSTTTEMTYSSGTTYTANIPSSANTGGTTIRYYVLTSGNGMTLTHTNADLASINVQNNGGSNYSYTVQSAWNTAGAGPWSTPGTWAAGVVPVSNQPVSIGHAVNLTANVDVSSITVADNIALDLGGNTMTINAPASATTFTGGATNNATVSNGTITFSGAGTQTIANRVIFNCTVNVTGTISTSNNTTIGATGTLSRNGGSVTGTAPTYTSGATLTYASGSLSRGTEWNATSGAGYPHHVTVLNGATISMGSGSSNIAAAGTLTINSGGTFTMSTVSGQLTVGALSVAGNLAQSTTSGSAVQVNGNVTFLGSATYTANSRPLVMQGSSDAVLSGANFVVMQSFTIAKSTNAISVTCSDNWQVTSQLTLTSGTLNCSGTFTIPASATIVVGNGVLANTPTFGTGLTVTYANTTARTTGIELPPDGSIGAMNINSGSAVTLGRTISLGSGVNCTVSGTLTIPSSFTMAGSGTLILNAASATLSISHSSGLSAAVTSALTTASTNPLIQFTGSGSIGVKSGMSNARVSIEAGASRTLEANVQVAELITQNTASFDASTFTITIAKTSGTGALTRNGTSTMTLTNGTVTFGGSTAHSVTGSLTFGTIIVQRGVTFGSAYTVNTLLQIDPNGSVGTGPTYATGAILRYATGGAYGRNSEWSATSGAGYPHHVEITTSTLDLSNGGSANRSIAGNLTISSGGALTMSAMTNPLSIGGSINLSGVLTLSSAVGGDMNLAGDFNVNTGATFTHNTREVSFTGSGTVGLGGTIATFPSISFMAFTGSGTFSTSKAITVNSRLRISNGTFNGTNVTVANGAQLMRQAGSLSVRPTYAGNYTLRYDNSTSITSGLELPASFSILTSITKDNSGTVTLSQNLPMASGSSVTINNGIFNLSTFVLSGAAATLNITGGVLGIGHTGGIANSLTIATRNYSGGAIRFMASGSQLFGPIAGLNAIAIQVGNGATVLLDATATLSYLEIQSGGTFNGNGSLLILERASSGTSLNILGTFQHGNGIVRFAGTSSIEHTISGTVSFYDATITPSGLCGVNFGTACTIVNSLTMNAGSYCLTNGPIYATGSTLIYNTNSTYNITVEWSTPHNVRVTNNTTLNIGGTVPSLARNMTGNLIIESGCGVTMNQIGSQMTAPFNVSGSINLDGTLTMSALLGGDFSVGGNLTLNTGYTLNTNSRAITFNGTGDQTIGGTATGPLDIEFLTVNKPGGTLIFERDLNLDNGSGLCLFLQVSGNSNLNGRSITLGGSGTKTLRVESGNFYTGGGNINVSSLVFHDGTSTGRLGGTIHYNGTAVAEGVVGVTYNNLTVAGSGAKSLAGNATVNGICSVSNANGLTTTGFSLVYGASALLQYAGSTIQTMAGEWPTSSGPVNVEMANTTRVVIGADRTISGTLNLTAGDLAFGDFTLTIGTSTSVLGNIVIGLGRVSGRLRRWLNTAATAYDFPIAQEGASRMVTLNFTSSPGSGGTITTRFIPGYPNHNGLPLIQGDIYVGNLGTNGIWDIQTADGFSPGTYNINLNAESFVGVLNFAKLTIVKRDNAASPWQLLGTHVTTSGTNANLIATRNGLSSFSQFGIAGQYEENPLPVLLTSFSGKRIGSKDILTWVTTAEVNNKGFNILSSQDGRTFEMLTFVPGQGNSSAVKRYVHDVNVVDNGQIVYYKLEQIDHDGAIKGTWIARVSPNDQGNLKLEIWPNPVNADTRLVFSVKDNAATTLTVLDTKGATVLNWSGPAAEASTIVPQLMTLPSGMYLIRSSADGTSLPAVRIRMQER